MRDPMSNFRRWWPRVVSRASTAWERQFAADRAKDMKNPNWRPTENQARAMAMMHNAFDAGTPDQGERWETADGRTLDWHGGEWVEVRW